MRTIALFTFLTLASSGFAAEATLTESPAERSIRKAQEQIEKTPDHVPYHNSLAMAYARRARETSDVAFYKKAEDTLTRALELSPGNFESQKVQVWLMLGRHEFAHAAEAAKALNKQTPDDLTVYGYLADANAELGNYAAAIDAAQWMLNLRPGNIPGLTRAAYLRELHGDVSGAIDLMQRAYNATPFQEVEDRAWLLTQVAHLHLLSGNLEQSESYATGALDLFPGYHYALGTLAQVREAQHRFDDAVALEEQRYKASPHAENLYALAMALSLSGRTEAAQNAFANFEKAALAESSSTDNANHELVAYYNDVAGQPEKALLIATAELDRRHDIFTRDAMAWSLSQLGRYEEAEAGMRQALATGVSDARLLYHAGAIQQHLGNRTEAERLLRAAALHHSPEATAALSVMR
ncbi:MAG: tetratricopeptide repeat protein [Acidobacteriota bacterium]